MDWSKGYSSSFMSYFVDPYTWADTDSFEFYEGSITRSIDSTLLESATIVTEMLPDDMERWIRIYLYAMQGGEVVRVPLFTGLSSSPERNLNGLAISRKVDCYSVLKPAADVILPRGFYAPAGSGALLIRDLLSVGSAPILIDGDSPITTTAIVAEDGETNLTLAMKILDSINWRLRINGRGEITICQKANSSLETFGVTANDVLETTVTDSYDWYSCPNVFMAISDDYGSAIARDDSPDSPLSTLSRGREIWKAEKDVTLSGDETIASYASRRLIEEQSPKRLVNYTRRYFDGLVPSDIVMINYPRHDLTGYFMIKSQSISIGYQCATNEEVCSV